jgi:hypothetical protein
MRVIPLLLLLACEDFTLPSLVPECPDGQLSDADLPCSCQGNVVDSLSCGELYCSSAGLTFGYDTGGCGR